MNRQARLAAARRWLPTYSGKNVVAGYRKWFGVDWECAFRELEVLGVATDPAYRAHVLQTLAAQTEKRASEKRARESEMDVLDDPFESDAEFAYIAGYTAAGFPHGIRRSELGQALAPPAAGSASDPADDEVPW